MREFNVIQEEPRTRGRFIGLCGELRVSIEVVSGLHVGSGQLPIKADEEELQELPKKADFLAAARELAQTIELDYWPFPSIEGRAVIPGSSVKGNVRARLELSFKEKDGRFRSCFTETGRFQKGPSKDGSWRHFKIWESSVKQNRIVPRKGKGSQCDFVRGEQEKVCLLCDLFGTTGLIGLLEFSDFTLSEGRLSPQQFQYGLKLLIAKVGSVFTGKVRFMNLKPEELGLVLWGMGLRDGRIGREVLMGRLKYVGPIGKIRYRLDALKLSQFSEQLKLDSTEIKAGDEVQADDRLVKELVELARRAYEGELKDIEEVSPKR
ncbi:MAG: RAMP superfamily CRISPR-associated protein [Candidatus Hadarchaeales archaeon]